jgi:alkylation response protein AidB-like acyl-CoA dehydrogenase
MATGAWHSGMALTEPGSGSDAAALRTAARREQDQWVVNGTKMWLSGNFRSSQLPDFPGK